ncbi:hypothetical protein QCA50_006515 [Cerrena zonata]|uniref:Protein phosphatase methylesterase 1 n=1 Tax=Cerrena zonata TaxID=2478898 RepID=A0AAW0GAI8_9APHY
MSNLYRSAIQARVSKLPPMPPPHMDDEDIDEEAESADMIGALPSSLGSRLSHGSQKQRIPNAAFSPISASSYFEQAIEVSVPDSDLNFRVYYTAPKTENGTVLVCHHGAGYSGLSFACFAKEIAEYGEGECGVLSIDCRGHGKTNHISRTPAETEDLAIETLTSDLVNLISKVYPDPNSAPSLLLVGHSLGGSVIVRACPLLQERKFRITGVAVLDVVEEFTLEALPMMHSLLDARPQGFNSPEEAVEWHYKTHVIRNIESARVSIPGVIVPNPNSSAQPAYLWRTPLHTTAPYWTSWFTGLSGKFLSARTARILVLAGAERLDKELMIGQMQGKFQLVVLGNVGHLVHEDDPNRLAEVLVEFWRRNERVVVGVKKVGEL